MGALPARPSPAGRGDGVAAGHGLVQQHRAVSALCPGGVPRGFLDAAAHDARASRVRAAGVLRFGAPAIRTRSEGDGLGDVRLRGVPVRLASVLLMAVGPDGFPASAPALSRKASGGSPLSSWRVRISCGHHGTKGCRARWCRSRRSKAQGAGFKAAYRGKKARAAHQGRVPGRAHRDQAMPSACWQPCRLVQARCVGNPPTRPTIHLPRPARVSAALPRIVPARRSCLAVWARRSCHAKVKKEKGASIFPVPTDRRSRRAGSTPKN